MNRDDEVGEFYKHFQLMQKALAADIAKQEEQGAILHKQYEELQKIHQQVQEDEQVQTIFLHNVTNRMVAPAKSIEDSVNTLLDHYEDITLAEANKEKNNIKQQSETIIELLSHKFNVSPKEEREKMKEERKEDSHE